MGASDGFKEIVGREELIEGVLVGISEDILVGIFVGKIVRNPEGAKMGLAEGNINNDGAVDRFNVGVVLGNPGLTRAVTIV